MRYTIIREYGWPGSVYGKLIGNLTGTRPQTVHRQCCARYKLRSASFYDSCPLQSFIFLK